jgi:acyl carrier protein|tara:strand:+ start:671 stop:898 length:228 start_codon:yes stop_codon:yes gene_type:complete
MNDKLKEILEDIFEESIEDISSTENFSELDNWDSLTYVSLIVSLQKNFSITLTKDEIQKISSTNGILEIFKGRSL